MSRAYPIWNQVTACIYKSNRSWGARQTSEVQVKVGSSASNSHDFVSHATTHKTLDNGDREFRFYVDQVMIRRAILRKGSGELEYLPVHPIQAMAAE